MRLTRAGEYAVRCVVFLATSAAESEERLTPRREVAREMDIPERFLAKIVPSLVRAGIIQAVRGAAGGLRLAKPAAQITLLEVVEAVVGEISLNDCVLRPGDCRRNPDCAVHQIWVRATDDLRHTLRQADFASLVGQELCMKRSSGDPM